MAIKVISLFSGGGGLDLGFLAAGYEIIWAIDNNKNAVDTYRHNIGNHIVHADINTIDLDAVPAADVVIGGPPCQAFSLAGKRDREDARAQLVWRYIQMIERVQPRAFVFENVTGLQSARTKNQEKVLDLLKAAFEKIGYTISAKVVNAAEYGVPQLRKRLIIVGLRDGEMFSFPAPTHHAEGNGLPAYINAADALGDLPPAADEEGAAVQYTCPPQTEYQRLMRARGAVTEHVMPKMSALDAYIIAHVKPGGNYMDIPPDVDSKRIRRLQRDGGHTTCYGRMRPDRPAYTINTYFNRPNVGCNIHYQEDRLITVREALRLQSFPDDFLLVSSSKQGKGLIVGNAVPPLLARVLAGALASYID